MSMSTTLLLAGNTRVPAVVNAVLAATARLREDEGSNDAVFGSVHIFHTRESLRQWTDRVDVLEPLKRHRVSDGSIVHHLADLDEDPDRRLAELVTQIEQVVAGPHATTFYVDLTNGVSLQKTFLAVLAYVLGTPHIYTLEVHFVPGKPTARELYLDELLSEGVRWEYRRYPALQGFDNFGKLAGVDVVRYSHWIDAMTHDLQQQLARSDSSPELADSVELVRQTLLAGAQDHLLTAVGDSPSRNRHSVLASSAAAEEVANVVLLALTQRLPDRYFGQKLDRIVRWATDNKGYFVNEEILGAVAALMRVLRNRAAHPEPRLSLDGDSMRVCAKVSSVLTMAFLQFATRALSAFAAGDDSGIVGVHQLQPSDLRSSDERYYFGFDGDDTGGFIAAAFRNERAAQEVARRSECVAKTVMHLGDLVIGRGRRAEVLFCVGDNLLFRSEYDDALLKALQSEYLRATGLKSSVGFGRTLIEADIALKLAKNRRGNSCVGIEIEDRVAGTGTGG